MSKKNLKAFYSITIALFVSACALPFGNDTGIKPELTSKISNKLKIVGKVNFPKSPLVPIYKGEWGIKATLAEVGNKATVSLIYPSNHETLANQTIATGLSNATGDFIINPDANFDPNAIENLNQIFVLEASKRIGSSGNTLMSLRTYLKWDGSAWLSITTPYININTKTTAITIVDDKETAISPIDALGKVDVSQDPSVISDIGTITSTTITEVVSFVDNILAQNEDPVRLIELQNGKYFVKRTANPAISALLATKKCPNCDLVYANLNNADLSGADLTNANLSSASFNGTNLSNTVFTGANLSGVNFSNRNFTSYTLNNVNFTSANLSGATLTGSNLSTSNLTTANLKTANLTGANLADGTLTGADLTSAILTGTDLSIANLTNANLTNAVLKVATLTGTTLTGANLSNAHFTDYSFCGANSIGSCNETLVNTYTTNNQQNPVSAMDGNGNFVLAWQSTGQDGDLDGIYAQRYNNLGVAQGSEFRVNTYTTNNQQNPSISTDNTGNFIITWQSTGQDGNLDGIYAQRYNNLGVPQGSEFKVNTYTTNNQQNPSIALNSAGNMVITWQSMGQDGDLEGIYAQRYNNLGVAQGSEFKVNTYTLSSQVTPAISIDNTGNFTIAWNSYLQDGDAEGIYAKRYNPSGVAQGSDFKVNTYTTSAQINPAITTNPTNGSFIIAWQSMGQDGDVEGIYAQRYSVAGALQGTEFKANTYTTNSQSNPSVTTDVTGNFVITWQSQSQDTSLAGVYAQIYNNLAIAQGVEFKVNNYTINSQSNPAISMNNLGAMVIPWQSIGQDVSASGVYFRRYNLN
jgi:uncharacterized protein YjbI with pentapeptide repeats